DNSFDTDGIRHFQFSAAAAADTASALLLDGTKIVVGGAADRSAGSFAVTQAAIARFNADGSFDTTFGDGGDGVTVFPAGDGLELRDIKTDSQGRYVAVRNGGHLTRFTTAGLLDTTFAPGGDVDTGTRVL